MKCNKITMQLDQNKLHMKRNSITTQLDQNKLQ